MSPAVASVQLPALGSRGRLRHAVDRFPHFVVETGATGTVTEATESLIALRMDEFLPGAEEWDNEVCWTSDDIEAADQVVAAVFYEDVEIIGGRPQ
ncbi:MAG TPA: hypothetical protein VFS64_00130 [Solirubrobacterales bacterium]|nr:hypothetical protein [Solirubrobacterales bacterium]